MVAMQTSPEVEPQQQERVCAGCQQSFALTAENFHRSGSKAGGFHNRCRWCRNRQQFAYVQQKKQQAYRPEPEPEPELVPNIVACQQCGEVYFHTNEHFLPTKNPDKPSTICRGCNAEQLRQGRLHRGPAVQAAPAVLRSCKTCGVAQEASDRFFYRGTAGKGLDGTCKQCRSQRQQRRRREREQQPEAQAGSSLVVGELVAVTAPPVMPVRGTQIVIRQPAFAALAGQIRERRERIMASRRVWRLRRTSARLLARSAHLIDPVEG